MKLYYVYSKKSKCEALYLCEDSYYINNPNEKTNVYPLGVILSKIVMLFKQLKPWDNKMLLHDIVVKESIKYFSYVGQSNEDTFLNSFLYMLLKDDKQIKTDKSHNTITQMLNIYLRYIDMCQDNPGFNNCDNLSLISRDLNYRVPTMSVYTGTPVNANGSILTNLINNYEIYNNASINEAFNPNTPKKSKNLFKKKDFISEVSEKFSLILPIYVFEINDIVDLIAISLQCIFVNNDILRSCKYCSEMFITHNKQRCYCPTYYNNKGCGYNSKYEQQLYNEKTDERRTVYKNISSMIRVKFTTISPEYNNFINKGKEYRTKIKNNQCKEEDYIKWMESYWKELKKKAKEEKQRKRLKRHN